MYIEIAIVAYIIDFFFGEFERIKTLKHPIVIIGSYIKWFENRYYKDSIFRGALLTLSLLIIVFIITYALSLIDNIFFQALLCSFALSSKMLYDSVDAVLTSANPKYAISMLVSRDTNNMNESDINKAAIETYAENLSDGVIAPLFYLCCFGIVGAFIYKAINTLDSMVGYRNDRYENFGKFSAKLDDIANFIPARITSLLIALLYFSKSSLFNFLKHGRRHESMNAGYPISAMALAINIKLGGPTSYFNKIKNKPFFGKGTELISKEDVKKSLLFKWRFDLFIFVISLVYLLAI